ncbi:MAG: hypothetical protein Q9159_004718, partial [Coniocarpon cinnabarinum]
MSYTPTPTLLLPSLPPNALVGIDTQSFTSTAQFKGLKDLEPGWHFVFASATLSSSLRSGIWFYVSDPFRDGLVDAAVNSTTSGPGEADLHVFHWDPEVE